MTVKYVARLRRTLDIEIGPTGTVRGRVKLSLETKDRQDISHYSTARVRAQANAEE